MTKLSKYSGFSMVYSVKDASRPKNAKPPEYISFNFADDDELMKDLFGFHENDNMCSVVKTKTSQNRSKVEIRKKNSSNKSVTVAKCSNEENRKRSFSKTKNQSSPKLSPKSPVVVNKYSPDSVTKVSLLDGSKNDNTTAPKSPSVCKPLYNHDSKILKSFFDSIEKSPTTSSINNSYSNKSSLSPSYYKNQSSNNYEYGKYNSYSLYNSKYYVLPTNLSSSNASYNSSSSRINSYNSSDYDISICCGGGFKNLGLTCYINSILSILSHIDVFRVELSENKVNDFMNELNKIIEESADKFMKGNGYVDTTKFKDELDKINVSYKKGDNDAHDFLMTLFNVFDRNQLNSLIEIFYFNTKTCAECKCSEKVYEVDKDNDRKSFLFIEKYDQNMTLNNNLDKLFNNNEDTCIKCEIRKCTKKMIIESLPTVLTILIHRKPDENNYIQLEQSIPLELDMSKYLSNNNNSEMNTSKYKLKGVVVYIPPHDTNTGHYKSFIKGDRNWYEYNDSIVSIHSSYPKLINTNSFLLFYERM